MLFVRRNIVFPTCGKGAGPGGVHGDMHLVAPDSRGLRRFCLNEPRSTRCKPPPAVFRSPGGGDAFRPPEHRLPNVRKGCRAGGSTWRHALGRPGFTRPSTVLPKRAAFNSVQTPSCSFSI